jgi:hypothetical protein
VGEIDRIPQITPINQALNTVQRVDDGARKQQKDEEEKPTKHDEVELTHEVTPDELLEEVPHSEDPPPSSLDLAV